MGFILCSAPNGAKVLEGYPQVKQQLQQAQWLGFVEKIDGHEKEVRKSFTQSYDGIEAEIGNIKSVLKESFVAESIRLPRIGESQFKNQKIKEIEWEIFLKNPCMDIFVFQKGIPVTSLKTRWRNLLLIIPKFITYEGRFGNMFFYHARLMMNFLDGNEINLPYFLLCSLRKMVGNISRKIQSIDNSLYHNELVKILIEAHLKRKGDN